VGLEVVRDLEFLPGEEATKCVVQWMKDNPWYMRSKGEVVVHHVDFTTEGFNPNKLVLLQEFEQIPA
jgi:hypothetical protein